MIDAPPRGHRIALHRLPIAAACWLADLPTWITGDLLEGGWAAFRANVRRHLLRLRRRLAGDRKPDIARVLDPSRVTPEELLLRQRRMLAAQAYQPGPYPGRIIVLRARTQPLLRPRDDASLGWARLAQGGVVVRRIPGNHLTLMRAPHVATLGAVLRDCLAGCDQAGG